MIVPTSVYKAIYLPKTGAIGAYYAPNDNSLQVKVVSVCYLEEQLGINLFPQLTEEQKRKEAEEAHKESIKQAELKQHMERAAKQYDVEITNALNTANLPKIPETVRDVAQRLLNARQKGYDLDVPTAVELVKEADQTRLTSYCKGLKANALLHFLAADIVREIRSHDFAMIS